MNPKGIILTGGPNSCYLPDSPTYSDELFKLGVPVLGLCYGAQLMMHVLGGKVEKAGRQRIRQDRSPDRQDFFQSICGCFHSDSLLDEPF